MSAKNLIKMILLSNVSKYSTPEEQNILARYIFAQRFIYFKFIALEKLPRQTNELNFPLY